VDAKASVGSSLDANIMLVKGVVEAVENSADTSEESEADPTFLESKEHNTEQEDSEAKPVSPSKSVTGKTNEEDKKLEQQQRAHGSR
jgi:hypothetical protein